MMHGMSTVESSSKLGATRFGMMFAVGDAGVSMMIKPMYPKA